MSGAGTVPETIDANEREVPMEKGIDGMRAEIIRTVGRLCAAAAVTAPKSGGQLFLKGKPLFIETVLIDDRVTLKRLADWMRARGRERRQDLWFRDAAMAERIDGVLFVGPKGWYPPIYDCGACGYATCAEFMEATKALRTASSAFEFAGPHCNLRDIDLGVAVGSAAKTASLNNVDTRCQTRIAVAARKLGADRCGYRDCAVHERHAQERRLRQPDGSCRFRCARAGDPSGDGNPADQTC
jgi:uncharacterized ferredoxin-like protein